VAKALLCPNCRARYPVGEIGDEANFPCERCGQILKVPESLREPANNGSGTAVLGPSSTDVQSNGSLRRAQRRREAKAARPRRAEQAPKPGRVPWPLRILAWLVAIPLGGAIVYLPARKLNLLSSGDLADVIIGTGSSRYVRLAIAVVIWALVVAILVQVFLVGGGALVNRWRGRRRSSPEPAAAAVGAEPLDVAPVPAPARTGKADRAAAPAARGASARSSQRLRNTAGRRTGS
jgi:hypothetical protein